MKKDLRSYEIHNSEYVATATTDHSPEKVMERIEHLKIFERSGFEYGIRMSNPRPSTHIDIGSGSGWLAYKTSSFFQKVIGIEPSTAAVETARKINKDKPHVSFINEDMVDGMKKVDTSSPVFVTTSVVLSHIEDYYVAEFLKLINELPKDSTLYFGECYDRNLQWPMWHIRNKDWWRTNLSNWQLVFMDIEDNRCPFGIFGICVGKEKVLVTQTMTPVGKFFYSLSYFYNIVKRVIKKIARLLHL